jgi:hypothetical protein
MQNVPLVVTVVWLSLSALVSLFFGYEAGRQARRKQLFLVMGITAAALVFDFTAVGQPYLTLCISPIVAPFMLGYRLAARR